MIDKILEEKILSNKIEITEDNIKSLIYNYHEIKDIYDIPDEVIERTFTYKLLLSEDFYYITERDLFIIDYLDPRIPILFSYHTYATIVFKKNDFVDVYVSTKLWTAKIKWFYPKEVINARV